MTVTSASSLSISGCTPSELMDLCASSLPRQSLNRCSVTERMSSDSLKLHKPGIPLTITNLTKYLLSIAWKRQYKAKQIFRLEGLSN